MSSYALKDVVHENGRFWVLRDRNLKGCFRVMRNEATYAVERAVFHYSTDPGRALNEAIENCDRRASGDHWAGAKA